MNGLTLREFFDARRARGWKEARSPKTIRELEATLGHWERHTSNPPLAHIKKPVLDEFGAALRRAGLSAATTNKHLAAVRHLLREAYDLELIDRVPKADRHYGLERDPPIVTDEDLVAIYQHCHVARYPRWSGIKPEDWWQCLMVLALVLGFRRGALLGLRWEGVNWEARTISLSPEYDKRRRQRRKPMSIVVMQHLARVRGDWEFVLPWSHSESTFYRQWRRIKAAAAIPKNRRDWIHDLKRTCATAYAAAGADAASIQRFLDHTSLAMTQRYINQQQDSAAMRRAVEQLVLPPAFYEPSGSVELATG